MTTETPVENFDCVRFMRETRDRISVEIAAMDHEELMHWLHSYRYSDPVLANLAARVRRPDSSPSSMRAEVSPKQNERPSSGEA